MADVVDAHDSGSIVGDGYFPLEHFSVPYKDITGQAKVHHGHGWMMPPIAGCDPSQETSPEMNIIQPAMNPTRCFC